MTSQIFMMEGVWTAFSASDHENAGMRLTGLQTSRRTFLGLAAALALGLVVFGLAAALGLVTCIAFTAHSESVNTWDVMFDL